MSFDCKTTYGNWPKGLIIMNSVTLYLQAAVLLCYFNIQNIYFCTSTAFDAVSVDTMIKNTHKFVVHL